MFSCQVVEKERATLVITRQERASDLDSLQGRQICYSLLIHGTGIACAYEGTHMGTHAMIILIINAYRSMHFQVHPEQLDVIPVLIHAHIY